MSMRSDQNETLAFVLTPNPLVYTFESLHSATTISPRFRIYAVMLATAGDIPLELHDLILDFLILDTSVEDYEKRWKDSAVSVNKHDLGSCALVSHVWTPLCQKKIFRSITLRSSRDIEGLMSLASRPGSRIFEYVYMFNIEHSGHGIPWIHLLCLQVRPWNSRRLPGVPFPNCLGHILEIVGPIDLRGRRNINWLLPRSIPTFCEGIFRINLTSVQFQRLRDLVSLVKELPSLYSLCCTNLSWVTLPSEDLRQSAIVPQRAASRSKYVPRVQWFMSDSVESWSILAVDLALRAMPKFNLHEEDFIATCQIAAAFVDAVERDNQHGCHYRVRSCVQNWHGPCGTYIVVLTRIRAIVTHRHDRYAGAGSGRETFGTVLGVLVHTWR